MHGLELVDVVPQTTHGGSMRYMLAPKGSRPVSARVGEQLAQGTCARARSGRNLSAVQAELRNIARALMQTLEELRAAGKAGRRLRSDLEKHDRHELLRHHAGSRRVHLRHDADQAGQAVPGRAHSGEALCGVHARLSRLCAVVCLEPCRRNPREGAGIHCRGRAMDRLTFPK